jgi:hypothetical protein
MATGQQRHIERPRGSCQAEKWPVAMFFQAWHTDHMGMNMPSKEFHKPHIAKKFLSFSTPLRPVFFY